jgi:RsiW-degrading membrane proteinase PrsW (M82 family)
MHAPTHPPLHTMSGPLAVFLLLLSVAGFCLYFLPTIIALKRNSPKTAAVVILNLFFGLTFVGWVVALILAFKQPDRVVIVQHHYYQQLPPPPPPPLHTA